MGSAGVEFGMTFMLMRERKYILINWKCIAQWAKVEIESRPAFLELIFILFKVNRRKRDYFNVCFVFTIFRAVHWTSTPSYGFIRKTKFLLIRMSVVKFHKKLMASFLQSFLSQHICHRFESLTTYFQHGFCCVQFQFSFHYRVLLLVCAAHSLSVSLAVLKRISRKYKEDES